eukprot:CAMPEP_0179191214 /NCGR_PEP_ID=MMETSP0796-20121207/94970_1 /TAXON_ID=73915 /ORGANISM="Pyrodinium bahamense, Strain pbaha01" /LENGTH=218 /DNA_ID=CAMNT_0020895429 /DNA_START=384 /DNA_END=1037 /DNA_ORIENTATION=+
MSASSSSKARRSPSSQTASSAQPWRCLLGAPVSAGVPRSDSGYLLGSVVSKRALSFVSVPRPLVGVSLARPAASSPDDARAPRGGDTRPPLVRRSKASRPPTGALSPCAASPGRVPPRDLGPGSAKDLVTQAATAVTAASMSAPAREPLPFRDNGGRSVPLPAAPLFRGDNVEHPQALALAETVAAGITTAASLPDTAATLRPRVAAGSKWRRLHMGV